MNKFPNSELVDEENPEWTEAMLKESKTAAELFPHLFNSVGIEKVSVEIDYDADIVSAFRAAGSNWQLRMNDALREWLQEHAL